MRKWRSCKTVEELLMVVNGDNFLTSFVDDSIHAPVDLSCM